MTINRWFQMHVSTLYDSHVGKFTGDIEGPYAWKTVLARAQEIIDLKPNSKWDIPHYAEVSEVELGAGALYENGRYGWTKSKDLDGVGELPTHVMDAPPVARDTRGFLVLQYTNNGQDLAVKEFVDGAMNIEWILATRPLEKLLVFEVVIKPVATIGVDLEAFSAKDAFSDGGTDLAVPIKNMETDPAPVVDGLPIAGFRCWRLIVPSKITDGQIVDGEPRLYGPNYPLGWLVRRSEWKDGEQQSFCSASGLHALSARCDCGLYALHDLTDDLVKTHYRNPRVSLETPVRGAVLGYGDVLVHDQGWRAQSARIIAFEREGVPARFLPALQRVAQKFDVPILSTEELVALAHRRGRILRKSNLEEVD